MSKVVKAVAVGALIGLGGFYLLPALKMAAPFASGAFGLSGLAASMAGTAFYAGLGALASSFLVKRPGNTATVEDRLRISMDPQTPAKWVFGETACATDAIYAQQHGEGTEQDIVTYVIAAAAHKIDSFGSLYVNDELITFSGEAATGEYADTLWRATRVGTEDQTAIGAIVPFDGLLWPSDAEGAGIAHYMLRWKVGKDKTKGGVPTRITQIVKGMPVYDPRLDSTRGGSGSHRANDQSTWQYTAGGKDIGANWALVVLSYLIGWRNNGKLVFGVGCPLSDIDYTQAIAAANVCDETVDGKPRFRIGGMFETSNDHEQILAQLESSIGGSIGFIGGKYYIWAPNDDLIPFQTVRDGDIVRDAGIEFIPSGPLEQLHNTARGRHVNPDELYQLTPYAEVTESTAVTYDGRERVMSMDFPLIQDESIAQRVARHMVRRSRFSATWRFTMGPKGYLFAPYSIAYLNCKETNYQNVLVRIVNMVFSVQGTVAIECVEEDPSIYDTSAPLGTSAVQNDPNAFDPSSRVEVTNLQAFLITIVGSAGTIRNAYRITWDFPGTLVKHTEVRYRPTSLTGDDWIYVPSTSIGPTQVVITDYEPATEYRVEFRHVTVFDVAGDWTGFTDTTADIGLTHYADIVHYYYQSSPPSGQGEKDNDIWVDSDDNKPYRRIAGVWTAIQDDGIDQAIIDAAQALAAATGKIEFDFVPTPPPSPVAGQYWFDTSDDNHPYRWNGTTWVDASDDIVATALLDALEATGAAAMAQSTADGKIVTFVGDNPPVAEGFGDVWLETDNNNALWRWNGSAWVQYLQDIIGRNHAVATGNPHSTSLNQITALMSAAGTTVRSGIGNDFELDQGSSYIYLKHRLANPTGSTGGYSGTLRTALKQTANGIVMGYNRRSDGAWVDTIVLDGTAGDAFFYGNVTGAGYLRVTGALFDIDAFAAVNGSPAMAGATGVLGRSSSGSGTDGRSISGPGIRGSSSTGDGVVGISDSGWCVAGAAPLGTANGVRGYGTIGGRFEARTASGIAVQLVTGNLLLSSSTTSTGQRALIFDTGSIPTNASGRMALYGQSDSGDTILGIRTNNSVFTPGAGPWATAGVQQIKIYWNGSPYWLGLVPA